MDTNSAPPFEMRARPWRPTGIASPARISASLRRTGSHPPAIGQSACGELAERGGLAGRRPLLRSSLRSAHLRFAPSNRFSSPGHRSVRLRRTGGEGGIRTPGRLLHLRRFSKALLSTTQPPLRKAGVRNKDPTGKAQGRFSSALVFCPAPSLSAIIPLFPLQTPTPPPFL